jgi:SPP1 family predicted phage head-tail adaptor
MMAYNPREKITIQKKIDAEGPFQPLDEYEDYVTIWTEPRFLKGRNFYEARAANVKTDVEFIIRSRNDLDETMRVLYRGKAYNIEGLIPLDALDSLMSIKAYEVKHDM